jgi:hypothetical protein
LSADFPSLLSSFAPSHHGVGTELSDESKVDAYLKLEKSAAHFDEDRRWFASSIFV